jgi:hypothetical protein
MEKNRKKVWVLVLVKSGIPIITEVYKHRESAFKRKNTLLSEINPENDELILIAREIE